MRPTTVQTSEREWTDPATGLTHCTELAASPSGLLVSRTVTSGPRPGQTGFPSRDEVRAEVLRVAEVDAARWLERRGAAT